MRSIFEWCLISLPRLIQIEFQLVRARETA